MVNVVFCLVHYELSSETFLFLSSIIGCSDLKLVFSHDDDPQSSRLKELSPDVLKVLVQQSFSNYLGPRFKVAAELTCSSNFPHFSLLYPQSSVADLHLISAAVINQSAASGSNALWES